MCPLETSDTPSADVHPPSAPTPPDLSEHSRYPHAVITRPVIVAGVWLAALLSLAAALLLSSWWVVVRGRACRALAALGAWDLVQTRHAILRLYPIVGHAGSCWSRSAPRSSSTSSSATPTAAVRPRHPLGDLRARQGRRGRRSRSAPSATSTTPATVPAATPSRRARCRPTPRPTCGSRIGGPSSAPSRTTCRCSTSRR